MAESVCCAENVSVFVVLVNRDVPKFVREYLSVITEIVREVVGLACCIDLSN
jgi:hypothetical protein